MKSGILFILPLILACQAPQPHPNVGIIPQKKASEPELPYTQLKERLAQERHALSSKYPKLARNESEITDYWITTIGTTLFNRWRNTPWDYNGTTNTPGQGAIACGFFVTTLLQDMGCRINRTKLAICTSSAMMKSLTPDQKIKNYSGLSMAEFIDGLKRNGKGVYIIGLDFHTGFIINDGTDNWFVHSNYIDRQGVTKERVTASDALGASKTRWMISLTGNPGFIDRWLRG